MKANELQIGDWVTGKKWRENPFKLTRINDSGKYYYGITSDGTQVGPFLLEEIVPIPLTPEILEKNGWEKCNIDVVDDDEQYGCAYGSFYFTWWRKVKLLGCYFEDKNVGLHYEMISELFTKYVHELQHVLRLCGIDKTIEL